MPTCGEIGGKDSGRHGVQSGGYGLRAVLDERKWQSFLQAFAQAMGGSSVFLRSANMQTKAAEFIANVGYDPAWQAAYCNHFIKLDYLTPALSQHRLCDAKIGEQGFSLSEQRKTEYFNLENPVVHERHEKTRTESDVCND